MVIDLAPIMASFEFFTHAKLSSYPETVSLLSLQSIESI